MRNGSAQRATWLVTGIIALLLASLASPAGAKDKLNSFAGSCSFEATAHFSPPVTNTIQPLHVWGDGPGRCSGTLNGQTVSAVPATIYNEWRKVAGSCQHAETTRPGHGAITFADGTAVSYSVEFYFPSPVGTFSFRGERSGTATGVGNLLPPRTSPDVAEKCAGEGLSEQPIDIALTTESPLASR
jgi:hypothetical protein